MQVERIGSTVDLLGESCVWSSREQALYWVDVRGPRLSRLDHLSGRVSAVDLPELAGATALRARGGVIVAMQGSIAAFDFFHGELEPIAHPPYERGSTMRFNDSRCDRQGRLWAGTMDDVGRGEVGTLYRLGPDHALVAMITPTTIPNSLAFSPDGRTMYYSDTVSRVIVAYDYDVDDGVASRPRPFAAVDAPGTADGSTVDADGFLWNAEYDGWRLTRYAPDGRVDRHVDLPVARPTCCTFGGPDLSILFVTSASQKLSADELRRQPLAGGLLAVDVGVRGLADPEYVD